MFENPHMVVCPHAAAQLKIFLNTPKPEVGEDGFVELAQGNLKDWIIKAGSTVGGEYHSKSYLACEACHMEVASLTQSMSGGESNVIPLPSWVGPVKLNLEK